MRVSEILHAGVEQFLEFTPSMKAHLEEKGNPHGVTKETVGLGKVTDDLQAKESDFRAHTENTVLDHPDGSVTAEKLRDASVSGAKLAPEAVTAEKIAEDAVGSRALQNESVANEHLTVSLRNSIHKKMDREDGMGLSQNSFTDAEKNKLAAISIQNGAATIDPATLVSREMPLKLCKTGKGFDSQPTDMYIPDAEALVCYDTFPANNVTALGYKNKNGNFVSVFYKRGKKCASYVGGTGAGHCTLGYGMFLAAEATNGVLTISKALASLDSPTFSTWASLPLSETGEVVIRHIFVRWLVDTSSYEITVIYAPVSYSYLHIDCFNMKSSEVTKKWQWKKLQNSYVSTDTRLLYSTWFKMACMDGSGTLYVAPFYCSPEPYGVLRLNTDGEITGRYLKVHFKGQPQFVMRDIMLCGKYLYGYTTTGITRIDTDTGEETCIYLAQNGNTWQPRGLMMLPDGYMALYALSTKGIGHILLFYPTGENITIHSMSAFSDTEIADTPLFCRPSHAFCPNVEAVYLDAETGEMTSRLFRGYDIYSVI